MHKKLIGLIALFILLFAIGTIAAQEPTSEPASDTSILTLDDCEASPDCTVVVAPASGSDIIVTTSPEAPPEAEVKLTLPLMLGLILLLIPAVKVIFEMFLNSTQRAQIVGFGDTIRDAGWATMMTLEQGIVMLGANPEVEISQDPKVLAKALRDKDRHVFIHSSVDVDAVIKAYQEESL